MDSLAGRTIALPESRQLDLLAHLIEETGGSAIRCPLVSVVDAPDRNEVLLWIRELIVRPFDDVVFYTGEGVRKLAEAARDGGLETELIEGLRRSRKISRGPKPIRALREIGLESEIVVQPATTAGIISTLSEGTLSGRVVGVQLFGADPARQLVDFLQAQGAIVRPVAPYRYASALDDEKVVDLIDQLAGGKVDLIAFTSQSQIHRLYEVAEKSGKTDVLAAALKRMAVGAVGPVVAETLQEHGIQVDAMPERSFTLKPLVGAIAAALARRQ